MAAMCCCQDAVCMNEFGFSGVSRVSAHHDVQSTMYSSPLHVGYIAVPVWLQLTVNCKLKFHCTPRGPP